MKTLTVNTKATHEKWAEIVRSVKAAKAAEQKAKEQPKPAS